jgi:transcriptional regulator CtsR
MAFTEEELVGQFVDTVGKECSEAIKKLCIEQGLKLGYSAAQATTLLFASMDRMIYHVIKDSVPPAARPHVLEAMLENACVNLGVDFDDETEETVQ